MIYYKYNDNELLYLISINNEDALEILIKKYYPLINNRIKKFNIKEYNKEDFFQECLITLYKVIYKFRDDKNGIFTLYLDNAIQDKIRKILKREKKYFYNVSVIDSLDEMGEEKIVSQNQQLYEESVVYLSDFEETVYQKYYLKNESPKKISYDMLCEDKKVYNALDRIKRKLCIKIEDKKEFFDKKKFNSLKLSELEREVYQYYIDGHMSSEIAKLLDYDLSKVLNAISRVKYKMKKTR